MEGSKLAMDSPSTFPDSPGEQEDLSYPCKGCGEILEEGKAFELAGNRWHIDCFRCNTCKTLLDSDANLLLLGDGSLICNNCTYSCSACGNKIEDLAILTGDQAFCASCFRCRNCKRKIENLRYARTSQGIFCMSCHESLMARRRKKSRAAAQQQKAGSNSQSPMLLDKSLPSLPPTMPPPNPASLPPSIPPQNGGLPGEIATPPQELYAELPVEDSPRINQTNGHSATAPVRTSKRDRSPLAPDGARRKVVAEAAPREPQSSADTLTLPSTTYVGTPNLSKEPEPEAESPSDVGQDPLGAFIPMVFDDRPAQGPSPSMRGQFTDRDVISRDAEPDRMRSRDALPELAGLGISRPANSRKDSDERQQTKKTGSPHVAYQEKGRQPSSELTDLIRNRSKRGLEHKGSGSNLRQVSDGNHSKSITANATPNIATSNVKKDPFQLQEVPRNRRSGSARNSRSDVPLQLQNGSFTAPASQAAESPAPRADSITSNGIAPSLAEPLSGSTDSSSSQYLYKPKREDSLPNTKVTHSLPRKEVAGPRQSDRSTPTSPKHPDSLIPGIPATKPSQSSPSSHINGIMTNQRSQENSESRPIPPNRSKGRVNTGNESYPPSQSSLPASLPVSAGQGPSPSSAGTTQTDYSQDNDLSMSPSLPKYNRSGDFGMGMEEDLRRILAGNDEPSNALLRRVSSAVRHGRSVSDVAGRKTSFSSGERGSVDSSAPHDNVFKGSPESKEETSLLKSELRRSAQKIAELEARVHGSADMKSLDTKLREKRSTVAFLDSQREIVVRELEVLTEHITKAKNTDAPVNLDALSDKVIREFALSLERLKDSYGPQIEELITQKNQLIEENEKLARQRDQTILETTQLNMKNSQLADLNNELTQRIQDRYVANRDMYTDGAALESPKPNGLGIYTHQHNASIDHPGFRPGTAGGSSLSTLVPQSREEHAEGDPVTVLTAPHVVNIRKGQAKKFNWKKGGQSVAKGVSKGFKGAFSSNTQNQGQHQQSLQQQPVAEGVPYQANQPGEAPMIVHRIPQSNSGKGHTFNLFGQNLTPKGSSMRSHSNGSMPAMNAEGPSTLFGSDLTERADYERRHIPSIVTRCIEEVELRGMDCEGIYRKTGGNSLVKMIQEGFERSEDFDISDPSLDITAVTSALKQYFRKLPLPLITYDTYDSMLASNDPTVAEESRIEMMRITINKLPQRHRDTLEFLIFHLARVATREKENLMTPKNLAVVFAPTIMVHSIERELTDMHVKNSAVQFLIENNKAIFIQQPRPHFG